MKEHRHADRAEDPASPEPTDNGPESAKDRLDWRGVLERVREEFRSGRAPDGVQRGFH